MPDVTEVRECCVDKFTWKLATDVTNIILRVNYLESTMCVLLLTGFILFVADFKVQPSQPAVKFKTSVDSRSKVEVSFSKIGTASEKTVRYFTFGTNYTEQQEGTISLKDMTEPADTVPKVSSNLTFCSELSRNLSFNLERMNTSVHKILDKFIYEYKHFLHIDRYHDPHMDNVMSCQTVENLMKFHLQDTDKVADFFVFNCSTDMGDIYTDVRVKLHIMQS